MEVEAVLKHPGYISLGHFDGLTFAVKFMDIGVIILKTPATDITPAALPAPFTFDLLNEDGLLTQGPHQGTPFTVVGYGFTQQLQPPVDIPPDGLRRYATF